MLAQLAAGLLLAPIVVTAVPLGRAYHLGYAVLLGVLMWLAGLLVARLVKATDNPSGAKLAAAVIGALVGVGIVLLPTFVPSLEKTVHLISEPLYLVIGALVGYWLQR
jgi:hypothetical protein